MDSEVNKKDVVKKKRRSVRVHTNPITAFKDWTTWAALTISASVLSLSPLVPEPWPSRCQIAAIVLGLIGTLLRGPMKEQVVNDGTTCEDN